MGYQKMQFNVMKKALSSNNNIKPTLIAYICQQMPIKIYKMQKKT